MREKISKLASDAIPYVLVFLVLVFRDHIPVTRAEFWAEDGTFFFADSMHYGWRSLFMPVTGYVLALQRLIAYLATWLPVIFVPYVYSVTSGALAAYTLGYFSRNSFTWIVKNKVERVLICCFVAVGPGTCEVMFNLSNLQWVLLFWGFLLLLEKPFRLDRFKLLVFGGVVISVSVSLIWIPLALVLWYRTRNKKYLGLSAGVFGMGILNFFLSLKAAPHSSGTVTKNFGEIFKVPLVVVENFIVQILYQPFLGPMKSVLVTAAPVIFWSIGTLVCALGYALLQRSKFKDDRVVLWGAAGLGTVGMFGLLAFARSYSLELIGRQNAHNLWHMHYSFLPGAVAFIGWYSVIRNAKFGKKRTGAAFKVLLIAWMGHFYWIYAGYSLPRPPLDWPRYAALIEAEKKSPFPKKKIVVPIHPTNWEVLVEVEK